MQMSQGDWASKRKDGGKGKTGFYFTSFSWGIICSKSSQCSPGRPSRSVLLMCCMTISGLCLTRRLAKTVFKWQLHCTLTIHHMQTYNALSYSCICNGKISHLFLVTSWYQTTQLGNELLYLLVVGEKCSYKITPYLHRHSVSKLYRRCPASPTQTTPIPAKTVTPGSDN